MEQQFSCPVYRKCGGCQLQNMDYQRQLQFKQRRCEQLLGGFAKVRPILGMEHPYHYRNKVQAAFAWDKRGGRIISGVYQSGTHWVVPIDTCLTEDETADKIIVSIRKLLKDFKLRPYDEDAGRGLLRHVLIRRGFASGEILVALVTGTPVFTARKHFTNALLKLHPEITTVVQNINGGHTSMVLGTQEKVLYGPGYITDILCGCKFRISASSFYQINPVQTEVLYERAMELAHLTGKERVLDAYCGIGTIGMIAAKRGAGQVLGVELNRAAVQDAIANAKENQIKNIFFTCADAGEFMEAAAAGQEQYDLVFMDPPRAGASREFLQALCSLSPKRVVYISCNPETLARDLTFLRQHHYTAETIQPVDMFPHTRHIETVVLLSQRKPDDVIEIDVDLAELDITSAETKATYREIQQYIMRETGLMVSNLYIAQIKEKCGIDKRPNYNLPKNKDSRQPKCPPEKEAAIKAALKHFNMI